MEIRKLEEAGLRLDDIRAAENGRDIIVQFHESDLASAVAFRVIFVDRFVGLLMFGQKQELTQRIARLWSRDLAARLSQQLGTPIDGREKELLRGATVIVKGDEVRVERPVTT